PGLDEAGTPRSQSGWKRESNDESGTPRSQSGWKLDTNDESGTPRSQSGWKTNDGSGTPRSQSGWKTNDESGTPRSESGWKQDETETTSSQLGWNRESSPAASGWNKEASTVPEVSEAPATGWSQAGSSSGAAPDGGFLFLGFCFPFLGFQLDYSLWGMTIGSLIDVCNDYEVVVDAFISYKKSKAGKRFAFVRFIKVDNIDCLVANLCTILIGRLHLHANVARFHRERKPSAPSHPSNANERNSPGSYVSILKSGRTNNVMSDQVLPYLILDDSCITDRDFSLSLMVWTRNTFAKVAYEWGNLVEWEDLAEKSLYCKRLCVKIRLNEIIAERFKVIVKGSVYWVCVKEMEAYDLFICNNSYESESSDDEEDAKDDGSQSVDKVTTNNDVERVSESSCMHNNDLLYDNNHNNIMLNKNKVLSEDPFNLYDILNKRKDSGDDLKYPPGFTPSVINMEEVNKKVKGTTNN
ncbi:RNA-directed DNA polymerase, eukaryota, nucleotide-binding alpha-beta plait domain protein, partial [Tanacetum coccineum]